MVGETDCGTGESWSGLRRRRDEFAALVGLKRERMVRRVLSRGADLSWGFARRWGAIPRGADADLGNVLLVSVYRARNAALVAEHASILASGGGEVRLWCLDEQVSPSLAEWTVGTGSGSRCELLNRLHGSRASSTPEVLVLDDDVAMTAGTIADLVVIARAGAFHIAQPAHDHFSHSPHRVTARRPLSMARQTRFVEVGPLLYLDQSAAEAVFPMPEEFGMGWGLDLRWSHELGPRFRFGIIDAQAMRHLGAVGTDYSLSPDARAVFQREFALAGPVTDTVGEVVWRPWGRPPT